MSADIEDPSFKVCRAAVNLLILGPALYRFHFLFTLTHDDHRLRLATLHVVQRVEDNFYHDEDDYHPLQS